MRHTEGGTHREKHTGRKNKSHKVRVTERERESQRGRKRKVVTEREREGGLSCDKEAKK